MGATPPLARWQIRALLQAMARMWRGRGYRLLEVSSSWEDATAVTSLVAWGSDASNPRATRWRLLE